MRQERLDAGPQSPYPAVTCYGSAGREPRGRGVLSRAYAAQTPGYVGDVVNLGLLVVAWVLLATSLVSHHVGTDGAALASRDDPVTMSHGAMPSDDADEVKTAAMTCLALLVLAGLLARPPIRSAEMRPRPSVATEPLNLVTARPRTPVSLSVVLVL